MHAAKCIPAEIYDANYCHHARAGVGNEGRASGAIFNETVPLWQFHRDNGDGHECTHFCFPSAPQVSYARVALRQRLSILAGVAQRRGRQLNEDDAMRFTQQCQTVDPHAPPLLPLFLSQGQGRYATCAW